MYFWIEDPESGGLPAEEMLFLIGLCYFSLSDHVDAAAWLERVLETADLLVRVCTDSPLCRAARTRLTVWSYLIGRTGRTADLLETMPREGDSRFWEPQVHLLQIRTLADTGESVRVASFQTRALAAYRRSTAGTVRQ